MVLRNPHIVSFRTDERMLSRLLKFAIDNGLYNVDDQPNVSAAALLLIATGFQDYQGQQGMVTAYEAARSSLMAEVRQELLSALDGITERIR